MIGTDPYILIFMAMRLACMCVQCADLKHATSFIDVLELAARLAKMMVAL